jgi:hypothetical protein
MPLSHKPTRGPPRRRLAAKYSPDHLDAADSEIDGDWKRVCVIELAIEHMTGKASIELLKERG